MKKTYNISLGGHIFHLEEDAGDKLQTYIRTLEKHYLREEGGVEIMNDIEDRIAELFLEYMQEPGKEVITLTDIEKVIQIMGNTDDIIDQDYEEAETSKTSRILYRDPDNSILGGVAAGIAAYFHISVLFVRLVFILLAVFYGIIILVYLILWIVIPAALTSRQKLEMKGEKINISNIEKNIKGNIRELKENKKVQESIKKTTDFVSQTVCTTGDLLLRIGKVILKIMAGIVFAVSLAVLITFIVSLLSLCWAPDFLPLSILQILMHVPYAGLFTVALLLTCLSPIVLLLWLSSKCLFQFKNRNYFFPLTLTVLWIIGIMLLSVLTVVQFRNFSQHSYVATSQVLQLSDRHPLVIKIHPKFSRQYPGNNRGLEYFSNDSSGQILGMPRIRFQNGEEQQTVLTLTKEARGFSHNEARRNAEEIQFNWELRNDTLYLDNYFTLADPHNWRANQLSIRLDIPENQNIFLDTSLHGYIKEWEHSGLNRTYSVKSNGLELEEE